MLPLKFYWLDSTRNAWKATLGKCGCVAKTISTGEQFDFRWLSSWSRIAGVWPCYFHVL